MALEDGNWNASEALDEHDEPRAADQVFYYRLVKDVGDRPGKQDHQSTQRSSGAGE
jgi:hypothetical protein